MDAGRLWTLLLLLSSASLACAEWHDSRFLTCLRTCEAVGCVGETCLPSCSYLNCTAANEGSQLSVVSPAFLQKWQEWVCRSECDYHCTLLKETEESGFTQEAIGYRDDWCVVRSVEHSEESQKLYVHLLKTGFTRGVDLASINEPASAAFSALNILGSLIGLLLLLRHSLHDRQNARGLYSYTHLWTGFGILSILYWASRFVLHSREMTLDKHLSSSFEVSLSMYVLCLAIMRVGRMRTEAARVIIAAPTAALLYTHLVYINLCVYDYGLNIQFCLGLAFATYVLWISWAAFSIHPGRYLLLWNALNALLVVILRLSDFESTWLSLNGEAEALWIACTVPVTLLWWGFAITDARYQSSRSRHGKATSGSESKKDL